jgi:hypothetical protein
MKPFFNVVTWPLVDLIPYVRIMWFPTTWDLIICVGWINHGIKFGIYGRRYK